MNYQIVHDFLDRSTEAAWRELLSRLDLPSHYEAPEYFLEPFWVGKKPFAILALEGDSMAAVLTGMHRADHVVCGLPARPQIAVAAGMDDGAALEALVDGLLHEAGRAKTLTVYTWPGLEMSPFA